MTQVKSKERVEEFGEVFTNEREVNAMLDLLPIWQNQEHAITKTFLEPACGNGNFLIKILERKIKAIHGRNYTIHMNSKKKTKQSYYERKTLVAVGSIYAIDIQEDNVQESIDRLYAYIENDYKNTFKDNADEEYLKCVRYILEINIVLGDGLTCKQNNGEDICFTEWKIKYNTLTRKEFRMQDMVDLSEEELQPIKEYEPIHYKEVYKVERTTH